MSFAGKSQSENYAVSAHIWNTHPSKRNIEKREKSKVKWDKAKERILSCLWNNKSAAIKQYIRLVSPSNEVVQHLKITKNE